MTKEVRLYDRDGHKFFANVDLDKFLASIIKGVEEAKRDPNDECWINGIIDHALSDGTGNRDWMNKEITYATLEFSPRFPQP